MRLLFLLINKHIKNNNWIKYKVQIIMTSFDDLFNGDYYEGYRTRPSEKNEYSMYNMFRPKILTEREKFTSMPNLSNLSNLSNLTSARSEDKKTNKRSESDTITYVLIVLVVVLVFLLIILNVVTLVFVKEMLFLVRQLSIKPPTPS